jgi:type II secretory pathway pseudopilin PulG
MTEFSIFNFQFSKNEKGQSLFELMVAIAISALVIVVIVSLTVNSIQSSNFSKNKTLASTYSQQASEWLRGQRDSNTATFFANVQSAGGDMCLNTLTWTVGACANHATIPGTPFTRKVTFDTTVANIVTADVMVSWSDSQGFHEVKDATNLADLR